MKETEFDIAIRNILQNAEEPVSPGVWEGVEAGLNRRRRFPVWAWSASGVAAAAAVVLGVFLLRPAPVQENHSNLTISIAETPEATVPPVAETPELENILPIEEQVARNVSNRLAQVVVPVQQQEEEAAPEESPAAPEEESAQLASAAPIEPVQAGEIPEAGIEDTEALNKLAYADMSRKEPRGFSLTAGGNLQSNQRKEVPSGTIHRAPGGGGLLPVAQNGIYNELPEVSFSLPFSAGVGVKYHFSSRLALGTGIRYTYMSRTFVADFNDATHYIPQTDVDNLQHWLGVPLNLYFNIINQGRWRFHTFVGGSGEFLVDNDFLIHASPQDIHYHQRGNSIQWSAGAGLGLEFMLTPSMSLYVDPSIRYYFAADKQPRSIRTIQPLRMEFEGGIRFSFGQ